MCACLSLSIFTIWALVFLCYDNYTNYYRCNSLTYIYILFYTYSLSSVLTHSFHVNENEWKKEKKMKKNLFDACMCSVFIISFASFVSHESCFCIFIAFIFLFFVVFIFSIYPTSCFQVICWKSVLRLRSSFYSIQS